MVKTQKLNRKLGVFVVPVANYEAAINTADAPPNEIEIRRVFLFYSLWRTFRFVLIRFVYRYVYALFVTISFNHRLDFWRLFNFVVSTLGRRSIDRKNWMYKQGDEIKKNK